MAQTPIESGYYEFDTVDGGDTECRLKDVVVPCVDLLGWPDFFGINPWASTLPVPGFLTRSLEDFPFQAIRTISIPESKIIGAVYTNIAHLNVEAYIQLGIPHYASGWLYKDIEILDPAGDGGMVDVQISATFDWEGGFLGYLQYEGWFSIAAEVEDITGGASSGMGGSTFVEMSRSGDQGVTDIAVGTASYDGNNETNHFSVKLQRGNTYRIYFKAQAHASPGPLPLLTAITTEVRAKLDTLGISIAMNEQEEIKQAITDLSDQLNVHDIDIKDEVNIHDQDIKSLIGFHDIDLKVQLDEHDTDIKARLDQIEAKIDILTERQLEVVRLLHTAQGQRQSDVPACDGAPCKWPNKGK